MCSGIIFMYVLAVLQDQPSSWQENYVYLLNTAFIIRLCAFVIHYFSVFIARAHFRSALQNYSYVIMFSCY